MIVAHSFDLYNYHICVMLQYIRRIKLHTCDCHFLVRELKNSNVYKCTGSLLVKSKGFAMINANAFIKVREHSKL